MTILVEATLPENIGDKVRDSIGAALVVGAGIAGMQAALDLAETGIKVYLLDRAPAIGGTMSMLDKTFPTNDCAMCIMSPKLVEVGRHLNIELLNCCEVEGISGEPGNFTVTVKQHPRYVDLQKCTGCGDCATACPVRLPDAFNGNLSERKAIYKLYPQAIPNAYAIEKRGMAPCRDACPIHQRAQGYLALIAEGRFADAYRTILEDNPFPSICGRVCNHRCEEACNRAQADGPVNIMALKRFVADWAWEHQIIGSGDQQSPILDQISQAPGILDEKRVAIVGSGPAGLTCARDLVRLGCQVTVFEALPVPGGMMRVGVPGHRLPASIVQREIDAILAQGVELRLNQRVDEVEALLSEYDAVFLAIGAHASVKLPIPGNDLPQVLLATRLLREVSLALGGLDQPVPSQTLEGFNISSPQGLRPDIQGQRVLVLGGGNVAIDAAMTAVRLGAAWVGMTCLESRAQMPAHSWEIQEAEEEGIEVFPARTFVEITQMGGKVSGVRTRNVTFRGFIEGRPDFDELPETETVIPADVVIFAIGQRPESCCLKEARRVRGDRIEVDPETLATSVPGIYAGGDAVTGAGAIVDAIAAGRQAAHSIEAYLSHAADPVASSSNRTIAKLSPQEVSQRITSGSSSATSRCEVSKRDPLTRKSDFGEMYYGLTEDQARLEAARCLRCGICSECNQCVYACRAGAILHDEVEQQLTLNIGAVILTPGLEAMPGNIRPEYGFGRYPNVVTSLQFERMLSASGPFAGSLQRPSDGAHPRKIAWIQCVGSRQGTAPHPGWELPQADKSLPLNSERSSYCSSVCCMYTTKEAMIAKEHDPRVEPAIFYIDIRSFGKGFDPYVQRASTEHGIRYIRCMISTVTEVPSTSNLRLRYSAWEGTDGPPVVHEEEFEMVVLSVGLRPTASARQMAHRLGIQVDEFGYAQTGGYSPTQTSRPGIFAAGAFTEPKDIPDSVIEASCAAAEVSALLGKARGTQTRLPEFPLERDISDEAPRVGVFVCHCGVNIGAVVDTAAVVAHAATLLDVVYAEHNLYTCSQDTQERISRQIQEHGLNRVVVASCTPRTHEPLFQDTLRRAGLNPHLFEMANIREQDSWVHRSLPLPATEKAKQLVTMAVAKARKLRGIQRNSFDVNHQALVIGGGLAGMTASLSIASQGFGVYLVERQHELGGNLRHIFTGTFPGENPPQLLQDAIARVNSTPLITLFTASQVISFSGYPGQYTAVVQHADRSLTELHFGAVVVTTGGKEMDPAGYLYAEHTRVITQRQLEERLGDPAFIASLAGRTLTMLQCVGSRDEDHPYCSRICCTQALKNALFIKRQQPGVQIIVLYRDLRSYGFREQLYLEARRLGVIFLEYGETDKPRVTPDGDTSLAITVNVQPEHEQLVLHADWLVLSTGIEAEPGNSAIAQLLKVPLSSDGFFLEAHTKLRPVDFAAEGIFLAGLAHSPRSLDETVAQAKAAAVRAVTLLSRSRLAATPIVASVNPRLCTACGLCVETCPYAARVLEPGMAHVEVVEVLCQGCGACSAVCPNKATQQKGFRFEQIFSMLEAIQPGQDG